MGSLQRLSNSLICIRLAAMYNERLGFSVELSNPYSEDWTMRIRRAAKLYTIVAAAALAIVSIARAGQQPGPTNGQQAGPAAGQQAQPAQGPAGQGQRPEPKNLQVLKGLDGQQVFRTMQGFNSGLGVECNFCHHPPFDADTP